MHQSKIAVGAALVLVLGLAGGFALGRRGAADARRPPSDESAVVATFEGGVITANELRAAMEEQGPLLRQELSTAAGRKRLAEDLVRQKLMEQDAAAKGYDQGPDYLRDRRRALAALYLKKELEEPLAQRAQTDAELQAYLDRHRAEYAQPERVRIAHIFLAAPRDAGPARQKKLAEAQALQQKLAKAHDYYAFATAARERSDDAATKPFGGDLQLMSRPELETKLGREVADAAFALRGNEVLADRVIETPAGFHLIKLRARVEATNADLASLRGLLRGKVAAEQRSKQEQEFFAALQKRAGVHVDEAALAAVQIGATTARR
jgi:peptidyl-prolyl cis-trans isomerase C